MMRTSILSLILLLATSQQSTTVQAACTDATTCEECISAECGYSEGACVDSCITVIATTSCFAAANYIGLSSEEVCEIAGAAGAPIITTSDGDSGTLESAMEEVPLPADTEITTDVLPPPTEAQPVDPSSCPGYEQNNDQGPVDCEACLTAGCVIGADDKCVSSCQYAPMDAMCWNMDSWEGYTEAEVCTRKSIDEQDATTCAAPTDCASCISTEKMEGESCSWYIPEGGADDDGYCGAGGCNMNDCPVDACPGATTTTEAPPTTTEAPPTTTEAPPATTEAPPTTTEAPPATTEAPPETTEAPPATTAAPPAEEEEGDGATFVIGGSAAIDGPAIDSSDTQGEGLDEISMEHGDMMMNMTNLTLLETDHPCSGFPACGPCLNSKIDCVWVRDGCFPPEACTVLPESTCYDVGAPEFTNLTGPEICEMATDLPTTEVAAVERNSEGGEGSAADRVVNTALRSAAAASSTYFAAVLSSFVVLMMMASTV